MMAFALIRSKRPTAVSQCQGKLSKHYCSNATVTKVTPQPVQFEVRNNVIVYKMIVDFRRGPEPTFVLLAIFHCASNIEGIAAKLTTDNGNNDIRTATVIFKGDTIVMFHF